MTFSLDFQKKEDYRMLDTGITIDTILRYENRETVCPAKIDTGSEVCLFERGAAEFLGIDVESGYRAVFSTLTGSLIAYGHEVEIETLGLRFQTLIYFHELSAPCRNLLGRRGWLQLVKLALVDYDCELYLSPYDE